MNQKSVSELANSLNARPVVSKLRHGFAPDAEYASFFVKASGSQNIERLYQLHALLYTTQPVVKSIEYDEDALTASIVTTSPILPFGLLASMSKLQASSTTLLHFKHGGEHNKLIIDKQVDFAPLGLDAKLVSLPVIGQMYKTYVLPVLSFIVLQLAILVLALYNGQDLREQTDLKYNQSIANGIDHAMPYINKARDSATPYVQQATEKAQKAHAMATPYVQQAQSKAQQAHAIATETASYAQSKAQETAQMAQQRAQEATRMAQSKAQEVTKMAQAKAQPYLENVQPMLKQAQSKAVDALSQMPVISDVLMKQGITSSNGGKKSDKTQSSVASEPLPIGVEEFASTKQNHSKRTKAEDASNPRVDGPSGQANLNRDFPVDPQGPSEGHAHNADNNKSFAEAAKE